MLIRLEYENRTLHETSADEISQEIVIGRGHDCAWKVAQADPVISSRHAAIFRKGRAVWIRDLGSKNGTFCKGKRITKLKLKIGARVAIGNHVVWVESARLGAAGRPVSDVQVLTGKTRGQRKPIMPPGLSIGSDPACGLVLFDPLVSRRHAEIGLKEDGSCWIRDLASKNGTMVNQVPLREDKERLLKEGDRIGIAHLEIEFHDGAMKKQSSQAWLRLGVIGGTLILAMGLYGVLKLIRPPADEHVRRARDLAAMEDFSGARQELEKGVNARRADAHKVEMEELRRILTVWETTVRTWSRATQALEQGDWVEASRQLGQLQAERKEAWTWNERASVEKGKAIQAKLLLDVLFHGNQSLKREDASFDDLKKDLESAEKTMADAAAGVPPHLAKLRAEVEDIRGKLRTAVRESEGMEKAMDLLAQPFPPYDEILGVIDPIAAAAEGSLRRRATQVQEPLRALSAAFARLNEMADMARGMEFESLAKIDFALPSADACGADARVSRARSNTEKILDKMKTTVLRVGFIYKEIQKRMEPGTGAAPGLDAMEDPSVLAKVFACDSLQAPFPKRGRLKPEGEYDRVLGIEEFYMSLRMLPDRVDPAMANWAFPSLLTQTGEMMAKVGELDALLNQKDNLWMLGGKLAEEMKRLNAFVARSDGVVKNMIQRAETSPGGREGLIAGGIALMLDRDGKKIQLGGQPLEKWLLAATKSNRVELAALNDEYAGANFDRQIEIRDTILRKGLPGDSVVRQMWVIRSAAKGK